MKVVVSGMTIAAKNILYNWKRWYRSSRGVADIYIPVLILGIDA